MQTTTRNKLPPARHEPLAIAVRPAAFDAGCGAHAQRSALAGLMSITERAWGLGGDAPLATSSRQSE